MKLVPLGWLVMVVALAACSEARSDDGGGGAGSGSAASGGAGSSQGGDRSDEGGGGAPTEPISSTALVINEISAAEDWIELTNTGSAAFELGGIMLADAAAPGKPKTDDGIVFPEGTSLAPGAFMFILAKQDGADPGEQAPQTACEPGTSPCFYAPFGLSEADGDELFLLDGEDVIASAQYPGGAVDDGQSYCRRPDGTGAFEGCDPTPGAPNR